MSTDSGTVVSRRTRLKAIVWFGRWLNQAVSLRALRHWRKWIAVAENRSAFEDVERHWQRLDQIPRAAIMRELTSRNRDEGAAPAGRGEGSLWKIAAGFSALAVLTVLVLMFQSWADRTVQTGAGEWETQMLDDGSTVRVGPRTRLRVKFGDETRGVRLERGEAFFAVAKDPVRPFVVSTERATARAIGTAFAVTLLDGRTIVTVKEGVVAVSKADQNAGAARSVAATPDSINVSAGQQVAMTGRWPAQVKRVDPEAELAWVHGFLSFEAVSVAEAVREFNLRNDLQLSITSPAVAKLRVDGMFKVAEPQNFAAFLERRGVVEVVRDGNVLRLGEARQPCGGTACAQQ